MVHQEAHRQEYQHNQRISTFWVEQIIKNATGNGSNEDWKKENLNAYLVYQLHGTTNLAAAPKQQRAKRKHKCGRRGRTNASSS